MMKIKNHLYLFIAGFILFSSCEQHLDHAKGLKYYTAVIAAMDSTTSQVNSCIHMVLHGAEIATQRPDRKLDSSNVIALKKSYEKASLTLNYGIRKLSDMEEIDNEIDLKGKILAHFKNTKTLMDSALPETIQILGNGIDNLTTQQKESIHQFKTRSIELQKESAELDNLFIDFKTKYQITDEELKK